MLKTHWWWAGLLMTGTLLFAFAGSNTAQDKKQPYGKHDQTALYNSLREVINTGAKMFNDQGDHAGCFRVYQGSLIAVRPFLAPELQTKIDQSLANADKFGTFADRAFELRKVLDEIRDKTRPTSTGEKKVDDKKGDKKDDGKDKKDMKDKKDDKKDVKDKKDMRDKKDDKKDIKDKKDVKDKKDDMKDKKDAKKDGVKDGAKDAKKDPAKDAKKDPVKDGAKDAKKDPVKDAPKDAKKDPVKDTPKDAKKDSPKDAKKDGAKDAKKDPVKDGAKDAKKDAPKDAKKDAAKDDAKDAKKDASKDAKKDDVKDDAKDKKIGAAGNNGQVAGNLLFQGKAIPGGYFVTLVAKGGKKFSSAIQKDGSFQFKTPIPAGDYRIAIEAIPGEAIKGIALPPHYAADGTSGLSLRVQAGKQAVDLNLVK